MTLRAGLLNRRVTLQSPTRTPDGRGGYTTAWNDVATLWARVEPVSTGERVAAAQVQGEISHRVTIRHRAGITTDMRLLYGTRALAIVGPPRDIEERHEAIELVCNEET